MFDLWYRHLRSEGGYHGRIAVLTNLDGLDGYDVDILSVDTSDMTNRDVRMCKVTRFQQICTYDVDSILYLDLDILVVSDIRPLFAGGDALNTAHSNWNVLHRRHCLNHIIHRPGLLPLLVSRRSLHRGVSSSVFSATGRRYPEYMDRWSSWIHRLEPMVRDRRYGCLADQSYLNLLYLEGDVPMRRYQPGQVLHRNWQQNPDAVVWHFPGHPPEERIRIMKSMARA
jgi:hypothetical protein